MKIHHSIEDFSSEKHTIITIGTFDGVHKGHKQVIRRLNDIARKQGFRSVLLTFCPHPRHVLYPDDQRLKLLNTIDEKIEELKKSELQHFIVHEFTKEFSRTKSVNFVRDLLVNKLKMKHMVIGYDHHFGRNREGSYNDLKELAELYNFELEKIPPRNEGDMIISSTKIRELLLVGSVKKAADYLGYFYSINGRVVKGNAIGRIIGFPTANILVEDQSKLIPADGVYAVKVKLDEKQFYGMLNIGVRPTLSDREHRIEVHIFDFEADIYDAGLKIEFIKRIREEKQFDNLRLLGKQLQIDKNNCKKLFRI